jgi:glucosamine-6-phosphate deaminase
MTANYPRGADMKKYIYETSGDMAAAAGHCAAQVIRKAIKEKGQANVILATGASQFDMLRNLVVRPGIDWLRVVMFHLDEYIGVRADHPASFRKYLQERFVDRVAPLQSVYRARGRETRRGSAAGWGR